MKKLRTMITCIITVSLTMVITVVIVGIEQNNGRFAKSDTKLETVDNSNESTNDH